MTSIKGHLDVWIGSPVKEPAARSAPVDPRPFGTDRVLGGHTYEFAVKAHCGVEFIGLDGDLWQAADPLGDGNVPPGGLGCSMELSRSSLTT